MIQIDLLVAYSMSSGLALAAGKQLTEEPDRWVNRYSFATLSWLTLLFGPQVLYLLWEFPCWETMFVAGSHDAIPSWLVAGYPILATSLGLLGFYVTDRLLRDGKVWLARHQALWSGVGAVFLCTYGWDGTGYQRMCYAGDCADWAAGRVFPVTDFLTSPVAMDLLWLEAVVVLPYAALLGLWIRSGRPAR